MVDSKGIEPSSRGCRPRILPLNDEPFWRGQRDSNPYCRADNAASSPFDYVPAGPGGGFDASTRRGAAQSSQADARLARASATHMDAGFRPAAFNRS